MKGSTTSKYIIVSLLVLVVILAGISGALFHEKKSTAAIRGAFDINGIIPEGASVDVVATRADGSGTPVRFASGNAPLDSDVWQYSGAQGGQSYTIQATLLVNGQEVTKSNPITVTAPANNETLTLNVESATKNTKATITGDIVINGYIPSGATVTIQGRTLGSQKYTSVATGLSATARQVMSYATAISGTTYEVQGLLYNGSTQIGSSDTVVVTAPAAHEVLTINSTAVAPATPTPQPTKSPTSQVSVTPAPTTMPTKPAVISGSIDFNGIAPPNSRIVILQKVHTSQNYQGALDNINPADGTTWTWTNPTASTWYDMVAVLKQRQSDGTDKDLSTSANVAVAAPATKIIFTLNSSFGLNAPNGQINTNCGNKSGNTWNATLTFDPMINAGSYWYQVGSSNGGTDTASATTNADGVKPLTIQIGLQNGTTYYVRYAYGIMQNLGAGSRQFSPFSSEHQIKCGS
ncbi:MAG: hypothetical protein ABI758_04785 [Candidatus Woesebacteria bacterium]